MALRFYFNTCEAELLVTRHLRTWSSRRTPSSHTVSTFSRLKHTAVRVPLPQYCAGHSSPESSSKVFDQTRWIFSFITLLISFSVFFKFSIQSNSFVNEIETIFTHMCHYTSFSPIPSALLLSAPRPFSFITSNEENKKNL